MSRTLLKCDLIQYKLKNEWIMEKEGEETVLTNQRVKKRTEVTGKERIHFDADAMLNLDYFFRYYEPESWADIPQRETEEGEETEWELNLIYDDGTYSLNNWKILPEKESTLIYELERFFNAYHTGSYTTANISFHSFDGGGASYSLEYDRKGIFTWGTERKYNNPDHDRMCGSGYDIIFTFYPLGEGEATAVVKAFSPIYSEPDVVLKIKVDKYLKLEYSFSE